VWSFGITCWEILTFAQLPYENVVLDPSNVMQSLYNYLKNGNRLSRPEKCSLELFETLLLCWAPSHTSRPNFKTLKETFNKYNDTPNRFVLTKKPTNDIEMNNQAFIKVYEDKYRKKNESKNRKNSNQLENKQATGQSFEQEISNHPESEQAPISSTTNIGQKLSAKKLDKKYYAKRNSYNLLSPKENAKQERINRLRKCYSFDHMQHQGNDY